MSVRLRLVMPKKNTSRGRGRPRSNHGSPPWFDLARYADAARMDAADWYLSLAIRCNVARTNNRFWAEYVRAEPLVRRATGIGPLHALGAASAFGPDFMGVLEGKEPSGVKELRVDQLYSLEKRLPSIIREFGGAVSRGKAPELEEPAGFSSPVGRLFEPRLTASLVRVDLTYSDAVLMQHMRDFLAAKRAELKGIGGPQPYREALGQIEPKQQPRLRVWAARALLPYLDLDQWRVSTGNTLIDAEVCRILGLSETLFRQTQTDAAQIRKPFVLDAWLLPLAREAIRAQRASAD